MNDTELRKLKRKELLEVILMQAKRIEKLELDLENAKTKINSKEIAIKESGSIAEAALKLSGIFEEAQKAADLYLLNVKSLCEDTTKKKKDTKKIKKSNKGKKRK